jgi:hypothetical protein
MILIQVHHRVAAAYTAAMTTAKPTPAADKTATIVVSHATSRSSSHTGPMRGSQHLTTSSALQPFIDLPVPFAPPDDRF